jgi:DNA (cytosine-5)-methyltransferase 1
LGFKDSRGTIVFKLIEIITIKKPNVIILENVTNLMKHNGSKTYKAILQSLVNIGYTLSPVVLDSSYFGVPQSRSRVYIVGVRSDMNGDLNIPFTTQVTSKTPLRPFLNHGDYSIPISDRWQAYIDLYTGKKSIDEISIAIPKTRMTLERVANGCDLNDCILQVRSSGVRALSLDEPLPTLTVLNSGGGAHIPILTKERRHISVIEMSRIMGFPDWYDFYAVSRTDAAKQLANAVCPPVIASLCKEIDKAICTKIEQGG